MNDANIIFLAGVHGVGKGTFWNEFKDKVTIDYLSASELLKWSEVSPDLKNKKVQDIPDTQTRLIKALQAKCQPSLNYLLDGHLCLLNSEGMPSKIDLSVFEKISPSEIIVLIADPEAIVNRLKNRDSREYQLQTISDLQKLEIKYAQEITKKLKAKISIVTKINREETINRLIREYANFT